ncbi:MAG: DUF3048 domain-containing protein [Acidimicrobiales bacterium]
MNRSGRAVLLGGGTLGVLIVVVILVLVFVSGGPGVVAGGSPTTSGTTPRGTPKPPPTDTVSHLCPLTGQEAPGGNVPQRPALAAKIGNDPSSRPQTGLPDADIVYEEMAEGGVTRYMAIFQCKTPAAIGPMRSVRWDDWHLLGSYGHPILSFSGGIQQWDQAVSSISTNDGGGSAGWLFDGNGSEGSTQSAFYRTTTNVAPYNYFLSASQLWKMDADHTPPPPQFVYSDAVPVGATAAASASIQGFASGATVKWQWDARAGDWTRWVGGQKDVDVSGSQLHATNVIIELMKTQNGPYAESCIFENGQNVCDNDVDSISEGSGTAYVLRGGKVEKGTWSCPKYGDVTAYHMTNGKVMTLEPGNTWVEVVPDNGYPVSVATTG